MQENEYPFVVDELPLGWTIPQTGGGLGFTQDLQKKSPQRPELLEVGGEGHLITIAPTGSGKTRGAAVPALLEFTGPMIVMDAKGELHHITSRRRQEMGHRVICIDPWKVCGQVTAGFNPMDILFLPDVEIDDAAMSLADEIVGHESCHKEAFWSETAKGILSGMIAHLATCGDREKCCISQLRDMFNDSDFSELLIQLLDSGEVKSKLAKQEFSAFLQHAQGTTRPSVQSSAQHHVQLFGSESVRAATDLSSFPLQHIIDGESLTIYFVVPGHKLHSHKNLLRLWISALTMALATRRHAPDERTLFLIDEAGTIGRVETLPMAMSMLRGLGVRVWTLWQDLSQLRKNYAEDWEMLLNNCATLQLFGPGNMRVANDYAALLGDVDGEMLLELERDQLAVLYEGSKRTVILKKVDYLNDAMFRNHFDDNRLHLKRVNTQLNLFEPQSLKIPPAANIVLFDAKRRRRG